MSQSASAKSMAKKRAEMKAQGRKKVVYYIMPDQKERADKFMINRLKAVRGS